MHATCHVLPTKWRWCRVGTSPHVYCCLLNTSKTKAVMTADRLSLQFTINKIVYKIFGAMSKDLYIETSKHFGIKSAENLVAIRRNRFIDRYGETDNYLCQMLR